VRTRGRFYLRVDTCRSKGARNAEDPFVITAAVVAIIIVAALATLGVMSAVGGQKSGLEKSGRSDCPKLSVKAAQDVTDPGYGKRLEKLARCSR